MQKTLRCFLGALFLGVLLAGCAVGPDYKKPPTAEPQEWKQKEDPQIKSGPTELSQWWSIFNDPVLDSLIQSAYEQNLTLRSAGVRILQARAVLGFAVGRLYPQSQALGGYLNWNSGSETTGGSQFADLSFTEDRLGFDAAWELDFFGRFRRNVQSNIASVEASIADYDDLLVTLTAEVARVYVLIRTSENRLQIARDNVKIQGRSLQIAEARFKGGAVTELDVAQARSLLKDTEASVPRLQSSIRQSRNALATLLGKLPGEIDSMISAPGPIPNPPAEVAVGLPAELLRRRPDIRAAERQVAAQSPLIGRAKADLYPQFSLLGSIGFRANTGGMSKADGAGGSSLGSMFSSEAFEFIGGPAVTWNIFNYGRIKNRVRIQDAQLQQLEINYQEAVLRAYREVEDAMVGFLRTQEEVGFLAESVKASKRSVDLSMIQYREGLADYQRVLDTQRSLVIGQDLMTATMGTVVTNLIAMYKGLGGGWEIRVGKDFVPQQVKDEMRERTDWGELLSPAKLEMPKTEEEALKWRSPDW
ncbi:efflux transporter outer membrane subunit [Thermodesulfobacteriota bacterium]